MKNKTLKRAFLGGLICGEGCFSHYVTKRGSVEFRFCIDMHERDSQLLEMLRDEIGSGKVRYNINKGCKSRNMCRYEVTSHKKNVECVIPFFEKFLIGYKKRQFDTWKDLLLKYYNGRRKRKIEGGKKAHQTFLENRKKGEKENGKNLV